MAELDPDNRRVLYGRRSAGKLRPYRRGLLDELLPKIAINLPEQGMLDPKALFGPDCNKVWLEIGFGGGEHLAAQAAAHPEVGFIGVEPFITGVARMLSEVDRRKLTNVRLLADDARLLLDCLTCDSIDRAFILFPDPWPKLRHQKRRIVNPSTLHQLARVLSRGSTLRLATDHAGYAQWMLFHMLREPGLDWTAKRASDWRVRPGDQPATRYEEKALEAGRPPVFFELVKKSAGCL